MPALTHNRVKNGFNGPIRKFKLEIVVQREELKQN